MTGKPISEIAQAFRVAFTSIDVSDVSGNFDIFPNGCCSWATWMLGHYLKFECGLEPIEIQGERWSPDGTRNHAWIEVNGLVVDITSDQFDDCPEPIYGVEVSEWHQTWTRIRQEEINQISQLDKALFFNEVKPSAIYERLMLHIRARCG